jgi:hypothetical protein
MLAPQRGRDKRRPLTRPRPSATLSPQEGGGLLGAPLHTLIIALSLGERGDRKAEGAPRFAGCGGEGSFPHARHPSRNLLPGAVKLLLPPRQSRGVSQRTSPADIAARSLCSSRALHCKAVISCFFSSIFGGTALHFCPFAFCPLPFDFLLRLGRAVGYDLPPATRAGARESCRTSCPSLSMRRALLANP